MTEIYDGGWSGRGVVRRLPEILQYFGGAEGKVFGKNRPAAKRRKDAALILEAALQSLRAGTPDTSPAGLL